MNDTREHIIRVAGRLFLQSNYDAVSIQDITRAVGMTKGALYHHFTSKEQLFEEVAKQVVGAYITDFSTIPKESLRAFCDVLITDARSKLKDFAENGMPNAHQYGINFFNLLWDAMRIIPGFRATMDVFGDKKASAWKEVIQMAIDRGEIRADLDARKVSRLFTSVADGVGLISLLVDDANSMHQDLSELWNTLYSSLKA